MIATAKQKPARVKAAEDMLSALSQELKAYCHLQGLEFQCAFELLHDVRTVTQHQWVKDFINRWEAADAAYSEACNATGWSD